MVIASLKGLVQEKSGTEVVLDVNGVGYRVAVSATALSTMPEAGAPTSLRIRTVVREDALDLYGFQSRVEEELFLLLTSVSHVGPKSAMSILSGMDAVELIAVIGKGDVARLTKVHGVGKKTAERVVLELKEKVKLLASEETTAGRQPSRTPPSSTAGDLISALTNLGYRPAQAEQAAQRAEEHLGAEAGFEALFRESLKAVRGP